MINFMDVASMIELATTDSEKMDCCKDGKCTKEGHDVKIAVKMANALKKVMMVKIAAKKMAKMDCCKDGKCTKEGHDGKDCCKNEEDHTLIFKKFKMKKIIAVVVLVLFTVTLHAQFTKATLQASGLTCSMCSKAVKVALEKVDFVQEVKVDIKTQEYTFVFKAIDHADFDALNKAVEDAGFSVASLKVTGNFSDVSVQKDKHLQLDGKNFHFINSSDKF